MEMVVGCSMNGVFFYLLKINKFGYYDNGVFGGLFIKIGYLLVDFWVVVDIWFGYGEDEDDIIFYFERNNFFFDGVVNGILVERMIFVNGIISRSLGVDRLIFDEVIFFELIRNELVEDFMQIDIEIVVLDNIIFVVCVFNEECYDVLELRVDDFFLK